MCVDMLAELSRREKEANIKPDSDVDIYMKVRIEKTPTLRIVLEFKYLLVAEILACQIFIMRSRINLARIFKTYR